MMIALYRASQYHRAWRICHKADGRDHEQELLHMEKPTNAASGSAFFETMPIGRLMIKFGIPAIVSMLVNSLYNIVDQIFIGQGVGYIGNAATNVCFPFVTFSLALTLLVFICVLFLAWNSQDRGK